MMIKIREKKQRGFISAELGIGIFVVSLLSISGFLLAKSLQDDSKVDQFKQDHITIVKNMENLTSNPSFDAADITLANVIAAGVIPEHLVNGAAAKNRFGGDITIDDTNFESTAHIKITHADLDKEQCINVTSWAATFADDVQTGTTTVLDAQGDFDMGKAVTQCGTANVTVSTLHMIN